MSSNLLNPKHYINEFEQLSKFIIKPVYSSNKTRTTSQKIEGTWSMFVVKFVLMIIVGVSIGLFYDAENKTTISLAQRFSPIVLAFLTILLLPLLEEIAFRLSLKFKPIYLALSLGMIGYYISSKIYYLTKLSDIHDHFLERVAITLFIFIVSYPLFSVPGNKRKLESIWQKNFKWILYFFCIGFAWIHIFNYELSWEHLLLMPIITLDKLVSALCYGYSRIQYGFIYSLAIHMLNNSIGFIIKMMTN